MLKLRGAGPNEVCAGNGDGNTITFFFDDGSVKYLIVFGWRWLGGWLVGWCVRDVVGWFVGCAGLGQGGRVQGVRVCTTWNKWVRLRPGAAAPHRCILDRSYRSQR